MTPMIEFSASGISLSGLTKLDLKTIAGSLTNSVNSVESHLKSNTVAEHHKADYKEHVDRLNILINTINDHSLFLD